MGTISMLFSVTTVSRRQVEFPRTHSQKGLLSERKRNKGFRFAQLFMKDHPLRRLIIHPAHFEICHSRERYFIEVWGRKVARDVGVLKRGSACLGGVEEFHVVQYLFLNR